MEVVCAHCGHPRHQHEFRLHLSPRRPCKVTGCSCPRWQPAVT